MATWGAYFASYVKEEVRQGEEILEKSSNSKPNQPLLNNGASQRDPTALQRSTTNTKKLYGGLAESTAKEQFQRSNSNAARVAKMFGYAAQAPAQAKVNAVQVQSVQAEPKIEERTQSMPDIRKPPNQSVCLTKAQNSLNNEQQVVQSSAVQEKAKVPKGVNANYSSYRKDSSRGQGSYRSLAALEMIMNDIQAQTEQEEPDSEREMNVNDIEAHTEQEETSSEREKFLRYERQVEQIRMEREQMDLERKRMLEERSMFQREVDRFAEEEEQMRLFVEEINRELERESRGRKTEERKRGGENEARQRARQLDEDRGLEESDIRGRKRSDQLEDERLAREEAGRLNRELRKYEEEVEAERLRYDEEEVQLRAQRKKDERIAKEQRRAAKKRVEGLQHEEEERSRHEEELLRYKEEEQQRRFAEESAERLRYQEVEAKLEAKRVEDERIAKQQRRVAEERAERLRYQEEETKLEVVDKEEELRKAEEKIRAAFANLAQERGQVPGTFQNETQRKEAPVRNYTKEVKAAGRGSRIDKGKVDGVGERGVSRYNTVAARPQIQEKPLGVSRGNTVGARPQIQEKPLGVSRGNTVGARPPGTLRGGLPNGPRGGRLPNGPRVGLPAGPRPRDKI